ncbi:Spo0E family sporulation regulatory protein-aspartic acid phosphatase [Halanaerobaculum tunisiense]
MKDKINNKRRKLLKKVTQQEDLLNEEVQKLSKKLDKVIIKYLKESYNF